MTAEELLRDNPVLYKDGDCEMRLVLVKPNIAVCLEWLHPNGEWVEVASMRPAAFNAFLQVYNEKNECGDK